MRARTIGDLLDGGWRVTAYCCDCRHRGRIDLVAAAQRYGRDATIAGAALRCICGSRRVTRSEQRHEERGDISGPVMGLIEAVARSLLVVAPPPECSEPGRYP